MFLAPSSLIFQRAAVRRIIQFKHYNIRQLPGPFRLVRYVVFPVTPHSKRQWHGRIDSEIRVISLGEDGARTWLGSSATDIADIWSFRHWFVRGNRGRCDPGFAQGVTGDQAGCGYVGGFGRLGGGRGLGGNGGRVRSDERRGVCGGGRECGGGS